MEGSSQSSRPKGGVPNKLLIVVILAVVLVAGVAAIALTQLGGSGNTGEDADDTPGGNDQGGDDVPDGTGDDTPSDIGEDEVLYELQDGDFMEYTTRTVVGDFTMTGSMRWEMTNVTSIGYDVIVTIVSEQGTSQYTIHANFTDALGVDKDGEDGYEGGVLIGTEMIDTPFGRKTVEHWQVSDSEDGVQTVTDYYIGAEVPVLYKITVSMSGGEDPSFDSTTTTELSDTNISEIRDGNA